MIKRRINRYVNQVLEYLPIRERRRARRLITEVIYDRLDEYCDGLRPIGRDLRAVLREFGTPDEVAEAYYNEYHKPLQIHVDVQKVVMWAVRILTVVALVSVIFGVVQLAVGIGSMKWIVFGTVLGLAVVMTQMVGTTILQKA